MLCFNHNSVNAIGVCSNCHKGLCSSCYQMEQHHLVCSSECAQIIRDKEELNERAKKIYGMGKYETRKNFPLPALTCLVVGFIFTIFAIINFFIGKGAGSSIDAFILIVGLAFVLIGALHWYRYKKMGINI